MSDLIARQQIATAAIQRFRHVPFAWGKNDCVRLAAFVLRQRGHRPQLGKAGTYASERTALRALKRAGFSDLAEALDALGLMRIAPAAALPCDVVMIPGEGSFGGALQIAVGNGRTLGYHQDVAGADILQPLEYIAAWRA